MNCIEVARNLAILIMNINEYDKSGFVEVAMKNYTQVYVKTVLKQQKHTAKLLEQK